jgi:hypothetical protein
MLGRHDPQTGAEASDPRGVGWHPVVEPARSQPVSVAVVDPLDQPRRLAPRIAASVLLGTIIAFATSHAVIDAAPLFTNLFHLPAGFAETPSLEAFSHFPDGIIPWPPRRPAPPSPWESASLTLLFVMIDVLALLAIVWSWRGPSLALVGEVRGFQPLERGCRFRLQRYDAAGNPLRQVPLEIRGVVKGDVGEGDRIEAVGWWSRRRQLFQAKRLRNTTTGARVAIASSAPTRLAAVAMLVSLGGAAIAVVGIGMSSRGISPLVLVGVGIFFSGVLVAAASHAIAQLARP